MNIYAIKAIYKFEMARTWRTIAQSIISPVVSTSLYFVVFLCISLYFFAFRNVSSYFFAFPSISAYLFIFPRSILYFIIFPTFPYFSFPRVRRSHDRKYKDMEGNTMKHEEIRRNTTKYGEVRRHTTKYKQARRNRKTFSLATTMHDCLIPDQGVSASHLHRQGLNVQMAFR